MPHTELTRVDGELNTSLSSNTSSTTTTATTEISGSSHHAYFEIVFNGDATPSDVWRGISACLFESTPLPSHHQTHHPAEAEDTPNKSRLIRFAGYLKLFHTSTKQRILTHIDEWNSSQKHQMHVINVEQIAGVQPYRQDAEYTWIRHIIELARKEATGTAAYHVWKHRRLSNQLKIDMATMHTTNAAGQMPRKPTLTDTVSSAVYNATNTLKAPQKKKGQAVTLGGGGKPNGVTNANLQRAALILASIKEKVDGHPPPPPPSATTIVVAATTLPPPPTPPTTTHARAKRTTIQPPSPLISNEALPKNGSPIVTTKPKSGKKKPTQQQKADHGEAPDSEDEEGLSVELQQIDVLRTKLQRMIAIISLQSNLLRLQEDEFIERSRGAKRSKTTVNNA